MLTISAHEARRLVATHLPRTSIEFDRAGALVLPGSTERLTLPQRLSFARLCTAWIEGRGRDRAIVWIREAFIWRARLDLYNLWRSVEGDGLPLTPEGPWPAHVFTAGEMDSAAMLIAIAMYEGMGITIAMLGTGAEETLNIDHDGRVFVRSASMDEASLRESLAPIRAFVERTRGGAA